jgi:hypothetical protein
MDKVQKKGRTRASLGREFGVDAAVISNIALGKYWKHVI